MKTAALFLLVLIIAPALALSSIGARRDRWAYIALGLAVFAAAWLAIRFLT